MKNIIYLVAILFFLPLSLSSCKHSGNRKIEVKESLKKVSSEVIDQKESKHSIKDFQGVWESFSEYLEHESAFKDYTQNKYYKIVNGKKTLDIILIDQEEKNIEFTIGYLGFLDSNKADFSSEKEQKLVKKIKESGNLLIRLEKGLKNYTTQDIEISSNFMVADRAIAFNFLLSIMSVSISNIPLKSLFKRDTFAYFLKKKNLRQLFSFNYF